VRPEVRANAIAGQRCLWG